MGCPGSRRCERGINLSPKGERIFVRAPLAFTMPDRHRCLIASFLFATVNIEAPTYLFLMRLSLSLTIRALSLSIFLFFLSRSYQRSFCNSRALTFSTRGSSRGNAPSEIARATSCTFARAGSDDSSIDFLTFDVIRIWQN